MISSAAPTVSVEALGPGPQVHRHLDVIQPLLPQPRLDSPTLYSQPSPDATLSVCTPASTSRLWSAVEAFLLDRAASNKSRRTLQFYREQLRPFCEHLAQLGIVDVLGVTANSIRSYMVSLATHRSAGGQHAAYRVIKAFLRWYATEHEPPGWTNPIGKVKPPKRPSAV